MFSARLPARLTPNALSQAAAALRAGGTPILDLTGTNPTAVGIDYPPEILTGLADERAARYEPDPLGMREARCAVAATYRARGVAIDPDRLVLTASTSEAYSMLFKLLCDPDDHVLVPQPSYPLFEMLSGLESVRASPYRLDPAAGWAIDREHVERALASVDVRALLVVSPNNPTGSMLRGRDRDWVAGRAAERGFALVSDEVFADYPLTVKPDAASLAGETRALTFALGGLSKSAGLPQMKLAWIAVSGPEDVADEAMERLAMIADTYLSVSTPVQVAAGSLIAGSGVVRAEIAARLAQNLDVLRACVREHPALALLEPEGGWSAVLRVPALGSEEEMALRLLREAHVLVHPGYFFDFEHEAFLVVSLLTPPAVLREGLARAARLLTGRTS